MNRRFILLSAAVLAVASAVLLNVVGNIGGGEPLYTPRSEFNQPQYAQGAFEFYKTMRANVFTGEVEAEDILGMREALRQKDRRGQAKNADINWAAMGPSNVGGRTRAILPFPGNPTTIMAGGVSGGMFKSTNDGQNWFRLPNFSENLIVSSIAMLGNGAIYVGTGHSREGFFSGTGGSEFMGGGLFVSNDEGDTWSLVSDFKPGLWDNDDDWSNTNMVVADPVNPDRLWVGTNFGLYPYTHGSDDLGPLPTGLLSQNVEDVEISEDGQYMIVAVGPRVYTSVDFGQTFQLVNSNPFDISGNSTIDLAISPYNGQEMYAVVSNAQGYLKGIYATTNAGQSWTVIAPSSNNGTSQFSPFATGIGSGQGNYDIMITVVPEPVNGNREIIMGGIRLYKYTIPLEATPGISLWENINANFASGPGLPPSPFYVHSDIHIEAWDDLNRLYIGCDGGIFRSSDYGLTWVDLNRNYVTTQFYDIAFSPTGQVLGGTQDNGTLWLSLQTSTPGQAVRPLGGDGFGCDISQEFPNFMFYSLYFGEVYRTTDTGVNSAPIGNLEDVSLGGGTDFFTDIALHENPENQFSEVFDAYTPAPDDPYLTYFPEGVFEVTPAGDTIIGRIPAGTQVIIDADDSPFQLAKTLTEDINFYSYYQRVLGSEVFIYHDVADTVLIQETPQFMLAAALSNGVYVTREPLKTNGVPAFFRISTGENSNPSSVQFSPDGDHLYVGYSNGRLVRFSGLNGAWTGPELTHNNTQFALTKTIIHIGQGPISDIDVDYSAGRGTTGGEPASQRVAITEAGYGGSGKVRVSNIAATAAGVGSFTNIWNQAPEFTGMPVYSVVMDVNNPEVFMVGTEYGVWYSGDNGATWTEANNGDLNRVPVFDVVQQKEPSFKVSNSGVVYAGSHGRGFFRTDYLFNAPTNTDDRFAQSTGLGSLSVFPNPMAANGTVQFDLGETQSVDLYIYTIEGRLVKAIQDQRLEAGLSRQVRFDAEDLPSGTYIVQLQAGDVIKATKFVKSK